MIAHEDRDELARLEEITASRFLYARIEADDVRPLPSDESWIQSLPLGIVRDAAVRLQTLADPEYKGERPPNAAPDVAAHALRELFALAETAPQAEGRA